MIRTDQDNSTKDLPLTRLKLREAEFFYERLANPKCGRSEPDEFGFYLSAFLSAGRSVTFVAQNEDAQFKPWFDVWTTSLAKDDKELLEFMNAQRVSVVHQKGPEVTQGVKHIPFSDALATGTLGKVPDLYYWFGPSGKPPPTIGLRTPYFELKGAKQEVLPNCNRYLALLRRCVQDYLNRG